VHDVRSTSTAARPATVPAWAAAGAALGIVGVALYVASWAIASVVLDGYDPLRQAISETFDLGAPTWSRVLVALGLGLSGLGLVAVGPALHAGLPGADRRGATAGAWAASLSGVLTFGVVASPCTAGCPGLGATTIDTLHVVFAAPGYLLLIVAPLLFVPRLRGLDDRLACWSLVLGGLALVGFLVRNLVLDSYGGLQQRVFNTTVDVWYVLAGVSVLRRWRAQWVGAAPRAGG
jgi:hypothetical protein